MSGSGAQYCRQGKNINSGATLALPRPSHVTLGKLLIFYLSFFICKMRIKILFLIEREVMSFK